MTEPDPDPDPRVAACLVPFEGRDIEHVKKRSAAPAMSYVRHAAITRRLIEVFGINWSTEVMESYLDSSGAVVRLRLTCSGVAREQWGGADAASKMAPDELLKSATSKALVKAASLFGVGLHLWEQRSTRDDRAPQDIPPGGGRKPESQGTDQTGRPGDAKREARKQADPRGELLAYRRESGTADRVDSVICKLLNRAKAPRVKDIDPEAAALALAICRLEDRAIERKVMLSDLERYVVDIGAPTFWEGTLAQYRGAYKWLDAVGKEGKS